MPFCNQYYNKRFFPHFILSFQDGWVADIYTGRLDPYSDLEKIDQLVLELERMAENKHYLKGKVFDKVHI